MTTGRIVEHEGLDGILFAAFRTRRVAHPGRRHEESRYRDAVHRSDGAGGDQIVECFRHGGGVPYSAFPRFQEVMAKDSGAVHDAALIDVTLPLVPGLIDRLRRGIDVADVGCGSGHAVNLMAEAFPRSRFTGFDFSDAGIAGALRPDGVYLCADTSASSKLAKNLDHPLGPFLYTVSCMHCMTVSLADAGLGLGTMWGEQTARNMLGKAGFTAIDTAHLDVDIVNIYIIASRG
jgi:hypothetical protein